VDVLRLLVRLAEATAAARERLAAEDAAHKALRSELHELRVKAKRRASPPAAAAARTNAKPLLP